MRIKKSIGDEIEAYTRVLLLYIKNRMQTARFHTNEFSLVYFDLGPHCLRGCVSNTLSLSNNITAAAIPRCERERVSHDHDDQNPLFFLALSLTASFSAD